MASKIITLITGGNQGVGYETAKNLVLSSDRYHVILGSRSSSKGKAAVAALAAYPILGSVESIQLDVTEPNHIAMAASYVERAYSRLDILVNNAGIYLAKKQNDMAWPPSPILFREVLETNAIGPMAVTEAFLPLLRKSSGPRLVFVSSSTGSMANALDPASKLHCAGAAEYRASKAALNMLMVQYYLGLKGEGITVHGADPGLVASNLAGNPGVLRARGAEDVEVGGERVASVVKGAKDQEPGRIHGAYGVCPW